MRSITNGWFVIDLMLKVGFLGTLVGFIWMLSSVSKHSVIDAQSMQLILRDMSYGMGIALNTTLISLVTATLLSAPYYLLSRGLDELIECTVRLTQVEVLPRLSRAA
jgi:biopolymer transport protein ExbB/TolQ